MLGDRQDNFALLQIIYTIILHTNFLIYRCKYIFFLSPAEEKLPEDETERLILTHPTLSKRPAEDDESLPKKKSKELCL